MVVRSLRALSLILSSVHEEAEELTLEDVADSGVSAVD